VASSPPTTGPPCWPRCRTSATATCSPCRKSTGSAVIVLSGLFERGIGVKVLEGIAAGEHTELSLILDLALALTEERRRDIVRKTKDGLEAARRRGRAVSAAGAPSSTTTSAPPSSPAASAGNPSAPSPPASRSPSASCTRP
jgi:hypothetical protein